MNALNNEVQKLIQEQSTTRQRSICNWEPILRDNRARKQRIKCPHLLKRTNTLSMLSYRSEPYPTSRSSRGRGGSTTRGRGVCLQGTQCPTYNFFQVF